MINVFDIVEACPFRVGIFGIGVGISGNLYECHVALFGVFCVSSDGLKVSGSLFGSDHACDDFLTLGIILCGAEVESG